MPSTSIGVYPGSASAVENDEVSSTYEGRHLTFYANDIKAGEHTLITKGHPVVIGEHIVGVALMTEIAAANNLIAIDTEGIWNLMVYPKDDLGAIDVVAGDELWINKLTSEISKMRNAVTHTRFGYALGGVTTVVGNEVIAVKVHWDGDDDLEVVGQSGAVFASDIASRRFREYHYEATGGGYPKGDYLALTVSTVKTPGVQALRRELYLPGDADGSASSYVGEFGLNISAGDVIQRTMACLKLNFANLNSVSINNYACAYIQLSDASLTTMRMPRLLNFMDYAALIDAGVDDDRILTDNSTDHAVNAAIRCGYGPNATPFWIMCMTNPPD